MSPRTRRWVAWTVVLVVAFNVLLLVLASLTPTPSGPPSSSYATAPDGFAGWAKLLEDSGHPVRRLQRAPSRRRLDPDVTLVVLDPDAVPAAESRAMAAFVRAGGRLVAGGSGSDWFRALLPRPPQRTPAGLTEASVLAPVPEATGVRRVLARAKATWSEPGPALPAVGRGDDVLLAVASAGRGRLALLSDSAPLRNRLLGQADNAALGLSLAGERGRTVVFAESYHGYGRQRGLAALPGGWQWALALLVLAALLWVAAHVRRLGPAEHEARALAPPRRAYVDALAATLGRTRDPAEAARPLQAAARAALARRAALAADDGGEELARAAARAGLPARERQALESPAREDGDVLAAGRALARLADRWRGT